MTIQAGRFKNAEGNFINSQILVNTDVIDEIPDTLFDPQNYAIECEGNLAGRGAALMFQYQGFEVVLKRYHRGGLPGRFMKESYVYTGLENTRMWREFHLLKRLHAMGLPVPLPIAARCELLTPFTYRGDLITERIVESRTLAEIISETHLSYDTWRRVGEVISDFHLKDVFHADLNANNILLTKDYQVFLIDFDKCCIRESMPIQRFRINLNRLRRSLLKLSSSLPRFHFNLARWEALERGYKSSTATTI